MGPHRSIWISSSGLVVLSIFFDLKELRTCFPLAHESQTFSWRNLIEGSPLTRSFVLSLSISEKLACLNLLCHRSALSSMAFRQVRLFLGTWSRSTMYVFPFRVPSNMTFLLSLLIMVHLSEVKLNEFPLSQNSEMHNRLCVNLLTNSTLSMEWELDLPTFPLLWFHLSCCLRKSQFLHCRILVRETLICLLSCV